MFEKLQRAEAEYRALIEQLPVIVYTAHPEADGAVFYVSPQVQSILGFAPQEWTADPSPWAQQLHPEDRERVIAEALRCRRSGDKFVCEYRIHAKDGRVVWLHDEAVVLRDAGGRAAVVQGLLLDVTEREEERSGRMRLQALSQDLVNVQETERRRIGLELHDDIGQVLTGLRMRLAALRGLPPRKIADAVREAEVLVDDAIESVRELSQSLRPAVLDDLGLLPALVSQVDRWSRQTNIRIDLEHRGIERRRFGPDAETAAYRIVQEALTNVARHSSATSACVRAIAAGGTLFVEIEDPGVGFDATTVGGNGAMHGLGGMRERVSLLGGRLCIESLPGYGCRLKAEIPLPPEGAPEEDAVP
jgi:PAS domain S-box-containing protein